MCASVFVKVSGVRMGSKQDEDVAGTGIWYLSTGALAGGRVYEDASVLECPMHVSYHGAHIPSPHWSLPLL